MKGQKIFELTVCIVLLSGCCLVLVPSAAVAQEQQQQQQEQKQGQQQQQGEPGGSKMVAGMDKMMDKMKTAFKDGKEQIDKMIHPDPKDSQSVNKDGQKESNDGSTSKRPEIFKRMDEAAARGKAAAKDNHGSYGTAVSAGEDTKSETGRLEKFHQALTKTQESLRNTAQKVENKFHEMMENFSS